MKKVSLLVALAFALAGCAGSSEVGGNPYSQAAAIKGQGGTYKIGMPYQILGQYYVPEENYNYSETGMASWYGKDFHARKTANGEDYNMNTLTAAHRTLPMPSIVKVTNLENGRSLVLRVNDRGPFAKNRIIDISKRGAQLLGFQDKGTAKVRVEILEKESKELKAALLGQPAEPVSARTKPVAMAELDSIDRNYLVGAGERIAKSSGRGTFVQAGSFTSQGSANNLKSQLQGVGSPQIFTAVVNDTKFYRVRFGPFSNDSEAQKVLARVKDYGVYNAKIIRD